MNAAVQRAKALGELLDWPDAPALTVTGVSCDSRTVRPGDLFLACRGREHDGRAFIPAALRAGAVAVVADAGVAEADRPAEAPLLEVEGLAARLGPIASRFYDDPSSDLAVVGVTGTNGKTTTTRLFARICLEAGFTPGHTSSDGVVVAGEWVTRGDWTGPGAARHVLRLHLLHDLVPEPRGLGPLGDPLLDAAVLGVVLFEVELVPWETKRAWLAWDGCR